MNATRITALGSEGRDQHATKTTGRDERLGRDEEADHLLRTADLSRWATRTGGPCLPVRLPRTFKSEMSDEEDLPDKENEDILESEERCSGD